MPVPTDCWRIVYRGSLPYGEVWQTGVWLQGNAPTSNSAATAGAQLEFGAEGTATPSSYWNAVKALLPSSITLDQVAVYSYPTGGTTAAFIGLSTGTPLAGTSSNNLLPNQMCACLSLLTDSSGRSYRGRMFLPVSSSLIPPTSAKLDSTPRTTLTGVWSTKFTDFNAASGWGDVVVVSQKLGIATRVTAVRMDSRPDVQRRRANRETGIVSTTAVVT